MKRCLLLLVLLSGCTSESHVARPTSSSMQDAGVARSDSGASADATAATLPESCANPNQEPVVTWEGWIEAHHFPSGSDRIRLFLEPDGAGGWSGFFLAGEGPELDTTPRDEDDCNFLCETEVDESLLGTRVLEGFRYPVHDVVYSDIRLRFDVDLREIFAAWCEAQTPIADEVNAGAHGCIRNTGATSSPEGCALTPEGEEPIAIPCCKLTLCDHVCHCSDEGCVAGRNDVTFDLFIDEGVASGTTPFGTGHLQQQ